MNFEILGFAITGWTAFGFLGQCFFGSRFIVQWLASERKGESYIPIIFWYLSVLGGVTLTIYAIGKRDIVFTLGQGLGCFIYLRNLTLIYKKKKRDEIAGAGTA